MRLDQNFGDLDPLRRLSSPGLPMISVVRHAAFILRRIARASRPEGGLSAIRTLLRDAASGCSSGWGAVSERVDGRAGPWIAQTEAQQPARHHRACPGDLDWVKRRAFPDRDGRDKPGDEGEGVMAGRRDVEEGKPRPRG